MHPLFGFILFAVLTLIVSIVAGKRGGALQGFIYFLAICAVGFVLVIFSSRVTDGNGLVAGLVAFASPLFGLLAALTGASSERKAVLTGEHGEYKKCPYCAEPVRKEAIKCKHCGSELDPVSGKGSVANVTKMSVTRVLGNDLIVDDFKVKELAQAMRSHGSSDSASSLLKEYAEQIEGIKSSIPERLHDSFDVLLSKNLIK